jgi:acyl-CoA thioesterase
MLEKALQAVNPTEPDADANRQWIRFMAEHEQAEIQESESAPAMDGSELVPWRGQDLGMSTSLDHSIYFHRPSSFRADEWLLAEMETPWAGHGRGLVVQKIWSMDGTLVATCIQEVWS